MTNRRRIGDPRRPGAALAARGRAASAARRLPSSHHHDPPHCTRDAWSRCSWPWRPGPPLGADWKPAAGPLMTRWAKDVRPDNALPEYPRPQLVRTDWQNLNGLWQLAFGKEGDAPPVGKDLDRQILVPFPVESALSGVMKHADRLWYRRTFEVPQGVGRPPGPAPLRRGRLGGDRLGQRQGAGHPPGAATTASASTSPTPSSPAARTS